MSAQFPVIILRTSELLKRNRDKVIKLDSTFTTENLQLLERFCYNHIYVSNIILYENFATLYTMLQKLEMVPILNVLHRNMALEAKKTNLEYSVAAIQILASLPFDDLRPILGLHLNSYLKLNRNWDTALSSLAQYEICDLDLSEVFYRPENAIQFADALTRVNFKLKSLTLSNCPIEDAGVSRILDAIDSSELKKLSCENCGLQLANFRVNAGEINISLNQLRSYGVLSLPSLKKLCMKACNLNRDIDLFIAALIGSQVEELDISNNFVGDVGMMKIAPILHRTNLKILNLSNNEIGDLGCSSLVKSSSSLAILDLSKNLVSAEGINALNNFENASKTRIILNSAVSRTESSSLLN